MDALDRALLDAWARVSRAVQDHPTSPDALRRRARAQSPTLQRPVRPWCLCIRAADTRIHTKHWHIAGDDLNSNNPNPPHFVYLDAPRIRDLVKPVDIDWPGIDWTSAADRLGRHPESLRAWLAAGVFQVARHNARSVGKRGHPVPFIYTHTPLDPNSERGRPPDRIWGHVWQSLHERIPDNFEQTFQRIPRMRYYKDHRTPRFRGWCFICHNCKRRTDTLFYPLPVWTLADCFPQKPSPASAGEGGQGSARPGEGPPSPSPHPTSPIQHPTSPPHPTSPVPHPTLLFSCHLCHKIRYTSLTDRNGWNLFISYISGGLLTGKDVPRRALTSLPESHPTRKRIYKPHRRPSLPVGETALSEGSLLRIERRRRTLSLLIQGQTYQQIAAELGATYITTHEDIRTIYKAHKVRTRKALLVQWQNGCHQQAPGLTPAVPEEKQP